MFYVLHLFRQWNDEQQEEFLNFCTGTKGIKILYDSVFKEISDTGINMDLLQEYVYIPLDVFQKIVQNKGVRNKLEAWLMFFSTDEPEKMAELMEKYPEFQKMYREIYELCLNVEKVMEMFSKELQELDRNTVQYMIDEMQEEIDGLKADLQEKENVLSKKEAENNALREQIRKLMQE